MGCTSTKQSARFTPSNYIDTGLSANIQKAPPREIQSVQLHPPGKPGQAPIIELNSKESLLLSFDYLGKQSRQFRVEISHRTKNWEESSLSPSSYMAGFYQTHIQRMQTSFSQRPTYQHVEFEFPNGQLRPTKSGNYLLEIYSDQGDSLLFSMPFFVEEDEGEVETDIQPLFAQRPDGRTLHQLFARYRYPQLVEYPQFDLSVIFVQNKLWYQSRETEFLDTNTPNEINAHQGRNEAFIGNLSFKVLDLKSFDPDGVHILEYMPEFTPPKIILKRDVQYLDTNPRFFPDDNFGRAMDELSSEYALVNFSLDTDEHIPSPAEIYITGHFNNWMINPDNKMAYNNNNGLWEGEVLIKQGEYGYTYALVHEGFIDLFTLDQSFQSAEQEYFTLVYFKDPQRNYDRLLKVDRIIYK